MNDKKIVGNSNLETLRSVTENIGGLTTAELEKECEYLRAGIKAARGKIFRAVERQRGAKWILKHRSTMPENVVKLALATKQQNSDLEKEASYERDRFLAQYRNFRQLIYIQKSIELVVAQQK